MSKYEFLATSVNNTDVYYDPIDSHAATHMADVPQLKELAKEIIAQSVLKGERILFDMDMGRVVGTSDLVENDPTDVIVYAKRKNRDIYTSFNKTKSPQPCSVVAVGFERKEDDSYELLSTWIGPINSPPFPGDEFETSESKSYWTSHSLAWGTQDIQEDTETAVCPW